MRLRRLTRAERLTHPWWGVVCPSCGAAPGEPCGADDGHIHGQRALLDDETSTPCRACGGTGFEGER